MNPDFQKIVEEIKKTMPQSGYVNPQNPGATHTFLVIQMSRLFALFAEDTGKSAEKLEGQTNRLVEQVVALCVIAEEQKKLAVKLDRQTRWLIRLTVVLALFTVGLFVVALKDTKIILKKNPQTHIKTVQTN
jgi:hypothetical protein